MEYRPADETSGVGGRPASRTLHHDYQMRTRATPMRRFPDDRLPQRADLKFNRRRLRLICPSTHRPNSRIGAISLRL